MAIDVNYYNVVAKDGQTEAERYAAMTKDVKAFYTVANDVYLGDIKLSNAADLATAVANIAQNAADIVTINNTLTKLEGAEGTADSIRNIIKGYFDAYTASDLQYKAAEGDKPAVSVAKAIADLEEAVGEGGSVDAQIDAKINELDATVSIQDEDDSNPLNITVVERDGKLIQVTGSIDANTFDAYGAATGVQTAITGTADDTASDLTLNGLKKAVEAEATRADAAEKAAAAKADAAQSDVDALEALVGTGYGTKEEGGETVNKTVKEYIDEKATAATYDDTALTARVSANEDAITLLNKTDGTEGSVKKTVDDAIAAVVADAPESLDTLKEISDWISGHESDAASMNSAIQENARNISNLDTEIGDKANAEEGTAATGLYKYVDDAVSAEATRATTAEGGLNTRIQALEAKAGDDSVEEQIQDAIEALDTASDVAVATKAADGSVTLSGSVKEEDGIIAKGSAADVTLKPIATDGLASSVEVTDSASNFTGTDKNVETVLAEIASHLQWQVV